MLVINYGTEWATMTRDALTASDIEKYLKPHYKVAIKPNLVTPQPPSNGATTHPEVVEGIILFLKEFGVTNISVIESSAIGYDTKKAYAVADYEPLQKKYGVPLIDLKNSSSKKLTHSGCAIEIYEKALETDFLINVPVLKAHCQTRLTCNMKNLKGCITEKDMRNFHTMGLHKPIAVLNALLKTGYCVVDGICGDLSFEEGGTPLTANRIIVGQNPTEVDSFCAELIGYRPDDIEYLSIGKKMGLGNYFSSETQIVELNADKKPLHSEKSKRISERYKSLIEEDAACSVCCAALIHALHRCGKSRQKIHIGQGFINKTGAFGVGNCTRGFKKYVPGCPPSAADIIKEL
ncbi:MAG: DUF362 domain-containing protein [Defluviitaleaceae bacterium]|nr:DUF362 domain-containing protein [Defluviitaleaceae bacterium]